MGIVQVLVMKVIVKKKRRYLSVHLNH